MSKMCNTIHCAIQYTVDLINNNITGCAQLSARLSAELCSPGLWRYYTTLRCTESEHFLWPLNRTFSG